MPDAPVCPSCGQPASTELAGAAHGWECRNEACPEFGQPVHADEPARREPAEPEPSAKPSPPREREPDGADG